MKKKKRIVVLPLKTSGLTVVLMLCNHVPTPAERLQLDLVETEDSQMNKSVFGITCMLDCGHFNGGGRLTLLDDDG